MRHLCPICAKPAVAAHRPFCSPRCAQVDLGRWLTGGYALPAAAPAEDAREDDGAGEDAPG